MAAGIRGSAPNPCAPAWRPGSTVQDGSGMIFPSNLALILPHRLLDNKQFTHKK